MRNLCLKNSRVIPTMLLIALIDFFVMTVANKLTAVVETTTGPMQGALLKTVNSVDYAAFKGIRYAEPPVGHLRFKPPIPIEPCTETMNATQDGADCIQLDKSGNVVGSEDCLFLNVFTTLTSLNATPCNSKPVFVWIHGGAFVRESSSSHRYRPDYLLEKDVVYAAFNYRLGPLGFLSLGHANATGNAGLKDQVLALKWLKANIAKFGGDPNKITIVGQDTGGASVGYHILSDASVGLFQGAITMSGVPLDPWAYQSPTKAFSQAQKLANILGTNSSDSATLLKTFCEKSAADLVKATEQLQLTYVPFGPTIEDKNIARDAFLTDCPIAKYYRGNFTKVPQIMGYIDKETIPFAHAFLPFTDIVDEVIDSVKDHEMSQGGLANYFITTAMNMLTNFTVRKVSFIVEEMSHLLISAYLDQTQQILSTNNDGKPIYYYNVSSYTGKLCDNVQESNSLLGVGHSDEPDGLFYYPEFNYSTDPKDPMRRFIDQTTTMATNFAKYGNPTPSLKNNESEGIIWPNSGLLGLVLNFGEKLSVGPRPTNPIMELLQATNTQTLRGVSGCLF